MVPSCDILHDAARVEAAAGAVREGREPQEGALGGEQAEDSVPTAGWRQQQAVGAEYA